MVTECCIILHSHRHPVSVNCLYRTRISLVCKRVLCVLCTKCTLHSNHRLTVWYSDTQNDFSPAAAIFSLHTISHHLAAEMWTTIGKQLTGKKNVLSCSFYLYRFRKYVSCGFPIISFCNPGVHYETPCTIKYVLRQTQLSYILLM